MKLGFFASALPYEPACNPRGYFCGGSTLALNNLVLALAKRKHNIDVFTTAADGKDHHETRDNLAIHRYGTLFQFLNANVSSALFYKPLNFEEDVVTVNFDIPPGPLAGYVYARKKQLPLVLIYHGDWLANVGGFTRRLGVSLCNFTFVNRMLSYATVIVVPSSAYIDISDNLPKYRDKVQVIANGINMEEFVTSRTQQDCKRALGLAEDTKVILYFGLESPFKGCEVLLRAMPHILNTVPDAMLLFAGGGPLQPYLRDLARTLGVESNVRFEGFVPEQEKTEYYTASDALVLPTTARNEVWGLVVAEALACGTPAIITRLCGIADLFNKTQCGYIVRENDEFELANTLAHVLEHPVEAREKAQSGKRYLADALSWEQIAEKFEDVYRAISKA